MTPAEDAWLSRGATLAIGYREGDSRLLDRAHGVDAHGEVPFTEHLNLRAGVRESDTGPLGDYVTLRWKMALD